MLLFISVNNKQKTTPMELFLNNFLVGREGLEPPTSSV